MARLQALRALLIAAAVAISLTPGRAQDYPSRNLTIIVPLAAGTGMDAIARLYGERLAETLGKPVIIENRPGANMVPPTQALIAAPADGHTLLVATPTQLAVNQTFYKKPPYDPDKELVPISHYLSSVFLLVVNPALPVKSVPQFLQYAKERPTPLNYSSPAGGGLPHYAVELMKQRTGLKLTHVPYKSSPQSIQDITAGHVDFAFAEAGASRALIQSGKLRALAVSSKERLAAFPDVPPFAEVSGMSDFETVAWHMLVARRGTPEPILHRLNGEMKRIMSGAEIQKRIANMGLVPHDPLSVADTEKFVRAEAAKWNAILKGIGLAGSL
jgi:tripartite-type tricarboxylate transporter receptor subunit TctC